MREFLILISAFLLILSCKNDTSNAERASSDKGSDSVNFQIELYNEPSFVLKEFESANVFPYYKDGLWGYVEKDGTTVIDAVFQKCGFFSHGFAWVVKNNKYGIINEKGERVVDYKYDEAGSMQYGLIPVKKEKLWGFISAEGEVVIPFYFEDYAFQKDYTIHVRQNKQWGIINLKGEVICLPLYDRDFEFDKSIAIVRRNGNKGLIDKKGKALIECNFSNLERVNDTLFIAEEKISYNNYEYKLLNLNGEFVISQKYKKMYNVSGRAIIAQNEISAGLLSLRGDTLINFTYKELLSSNTNLLQAQGKNNLWGYINTKNDTILPLRYKKVFPFIGKISVVEESMGQVLINARGNVIVPHHREIKILSNNLVKVNIDYVNYYFVDSTGKHIFSEEFDSKDYHAEEDYITGDIYDAMEFGKVKNGMIIVGNQGNAGMINLQGKMVVPMEYHHLEPMDEYGFIVATIWDKKGLLYKTGKRLTEIVYDDIVWDEKAHHYCAFQNVKIKKDGYERMSQMPVGYFGSDGSYYGQSAFTGQKTSNVEDFITKIREAYKRIEKEVKSSDFENRTVNGLKESFHKAKFIVKDDSKNIKYMYYYDNRINRYGPFFIYTVQGGKIENRYYFRHGKIIRWVDENKQQRSIANAMYAPEDEHHFLARKHLADFNNQQYLKNKEHNKWVSEVDDLCAQIRSDIANGEYKKGDSDNQGMGEYQHHSETYLDQNGDLIYSSNSESDEGGGYSEESFYKNGKSLYSSSNNHWEESNDEDKEAGWWGGQYRISSYYHNGNLFRTIEERGGVVNIIE